LFSAVVLVLLIACANIANLLLARSAMTRRDFAVRAAFGADRWALVRRSMAESGVLAATGGAAGLALAWLGIRALRPLIPPTVPRADGVGLDLAVLAFTAAMTIGAGVLFGAIPAWRAMKPNLLDALQEGGRSNTISRRSRWLSDGMVVFEVAIALVLVISAGLLLRSFVRLTSVNPGFRTSQVVAFHVVLPDTRYRGGPPKKQFYEDFLARMRAVPAFHQVAAVSALPMSPLGGPCVSWLIGYGTGPIPDQLPATDEWLNQPGPADPFWDAAHAQSGVRQVSLSSDCPVETPSPTPEAEPTPTP